MTIRLRRRRWRWWWRWRNQTRTKTNTISTANNVLPCLLINLDSIRLHSSRRSGGRSSNCRTKKQVAGRKTAGAMTCLGTLAWHGWGQWKSTIRKRSDGSGNAFWKVFFFRPGENRPPQTNRAWFGEGNESPLRCFKEDMKSFKTSILQVP